MTLRNVASTADRPEVELIRWRIVRRTSGDMHFVGCETLMADAVTGHVMQAGRGADLELCQSPTG